MTTASAAATKAGATTRTAMTSYVVPAEAGLILLTIATVLGFSRVFATWSFVGPMLAVACYTHAVSMITRRRGLGVPMSGLIALAGFLLLTAWVFFFADTAVGI